MPTPAALRFSLTADDPDLLDAVRDLLGDAQLRVVLIETHGPVARDLNSATTWTGWRLQEGKSDQTSTIFQLVR